MYDTGPLDTIDRFLERHTPPGSIPGLSRYLSIAVKRALAKEPDFFDMGPDGTKRFDWEKAKAADEVIHHIKDWITAALTADAPWLKRTDADGRPKRLMQISSLEDAYHRADKDMKKMANDVRSRMDAHARFEEQEHAGHIKSLATYPDGSRIVRLLTSIALDFETAHLGHCIGLGGFDDEITKPDAAIYSLRDPFNRARVSLHVDRGRLKECKGVLNAPPAPQYLHMVQQFIREQGWELSDNLKNTGLLKKDGAYYSLANLPENFEWDDDLDASKIPWLRFLPPGLRINGDLNLSGCEKLVDLPHRLTVNGTLNLKGCINLLYVGKGVSVGADLVFGNNPQITSLPPCIFVGGRVLGGNTTGIPGNDKTFDKTHLISASSDSVTYYPRLELTGS